MITLMYHFGWKLLISIWNVDYQGTLLQLAESRLSLPPILWWIGASSIQGVADWTDGVVTIVYIVEALKGALTDIPFLMSLNSTSKLCIHRCRLTLKKILLWTGAKLNVMGHDAGGRKTPLAMALHNHSNAAAQVLRKEGISSSPQMQQQNFLLSKVLVSQNFVGDSWIYSITMTCNSIWNWIQ